jgi:hypothetical protein
MERRCELILRENNSISGKDSNDKDVYIGTTVQKKIITLSAKKVCTITGRVACVVERVKR